MSVLMMTLFLGSCSKGGDEGGEGDGGNSIGDNSVVGTWQLVKENSMSAMLNETFTICFNEDATGSVSYRLGGTTTLNVNLDKVTAKDGNLEMVIEHNGGTVNWTYSIQGNKMTIRGEIQSADFGGVYTKM